MDARSFRRLFALLLFVVGLLILVPEVNSLMRLRMPNIANVVLACVLWIMSGIVGR